MRIDIHNHTTRCNHAEGSVEEYIKKAIELGIDIYGFSEHAPMDLDQGYRLPFGEMASYEQEVLELKERYKDDIEILLGYEVDWLPGFMDDRVLGAKVDYLVGSVHFINKWGFDNPEFIGGYKEREIDAIWEDYFEAIATMAKSNLFDIVGHLDLPKVFKFLPKKDIRLLAKEALKAIKQSGMALEINTSGLRKPINEIYPSKALLQEAFALDIPITFSSDAHALEHIGYGYDDALKLAKDVGYTHALYFKNREKESALFH